MMNISLSKLGYSFKSKPLVIGGRAKEYYGIRKSGDDIDLVVTADDYTALAAKYPNDLKDLGGDLGVAAYNFEIWRTICLFDYDYLSQNAIALGECTIISLEKLVFLTALAMKKQKYLDDLYLLVDKALKDKYKNHDKSG